MQSRISPGRGIAIAPIRKQGKMVRTLLLMAQEMCLALELLATLIAGR
jgi:hypothetical protein